LNAAVEAARAGEQGRGFAVVASEVRSLAQRSAAAAKEIKELIASSVTMIQGSAKQATDVGATMGEVKQAIKQVSDIVGEIAAASEEQSRGIEQVHQAVSQMDEVTQQNAALVEQASAAAQSLEEQSLQLKDAVSVFRLANGGGSGPRVVMPKNRPSIAAPKAAVTRAKLKPTVQAAVVVTGAAAATASGAAGQTWEAF
jgi:methyl-accepting chemotaxis protein